MEEVTARRDCHPPHSHLTVDGRLSTSSDHLNALKYTEAIKLQTDSTS